MSMSKLEKNLHQARNQMNEMVGQLADIAIEDSSTYSDAVKKLKNFKWNFVGPSAQVMIESAIEIVEKKALSAQIKKY
ncbi:hypothetical protein [Sporosarcina sp. FSL K6-3457]|uniref:hypothetical protein n=1 Tax=Sporosarcina sp. FSL K6-3457 TaxID=2978204 RepID=UPI0030F5B599